MLRTLLRAWPMITVMGVLAGIAWAGHQSGWKLSSLGELLAEHRQAKDDWCDAHGVPECICVECNPHLMTRPKPPPFCEVHGVHQCPLEHPEVAQLAEQSRITPADLERAKRALDFKAWPENNPTCNKLGRLVQFVSEAAFNKMGVEVAPVMEKPMVETVAASGEFTFAQPRVTPLYTLVAGRVWQVTPLGMLGSTVKKGDVLALFDAAEVGRAKAEFLQAFAQVELRRATLARQRELQREGASSEAAVRASEAADREANIRYLAAQQALVNLGLPIPQEDTKNITPEQLAHRIQFLGLPSAITQKLDPATTTANLLPVRALLDGTVIDVKVTEGEVVDASKALFVVADASRMWLLLTVRPEDAKYIRLRDSQASTPGNTVLFTPDGGGSAVKGELVWRSQLIDEKTRTLQFRADVANPPAALPAHTFGKAKIVVREEPKAIVVPRDSIHWEGDCHVVFVRDKDWFKEGAPKVFHIRTVRPGVTNGQYTEVIAGLLPGEVVAGKNSTILRAEMLKNSLGAA